MKFDLKKPCSTCPFRTDVIFPLRPARRMEITHALMGNGSFACHNTVDYSEGDNPDPQEEQFCAGALIAMDRDEILFENGFVRLAERLGVFDYDALDVSVDVYPLFDWEAIRDTKEEMA